MHAGALWWIGGIVIPSTVLFVFLADRIVKPWRERVLAEAEEKRAVALIQSEEMRSAFRVLTGTPADPNQGVDRVKSLGERMTDMEQSQKRVEKLLNGGGLGAQLSDLATHQQEHLQQAAASKDEILARLDEQDEKLADVSDRARAAARLAGAAATTVSREVQGVSEKLEDVSDRLDALDVKVERRLFPLEDANHGLLATVHELLANDADDDSPDDAA
jgi:hypothetical protein